MKKYYIKAWFGDWKEVSKDEADKFINNLYKQCTANITIKQLKEKHLKVIANL